MKYNNIFKFNWKFLYIIGSFFVITIILSSCEEDKFLKTEPVDFYSPSNSFVTATDYDAAILDLYSRVRDDFNYSAGQNNFPCAGFQSTDMAYNHKNHGQFKPMNETLLPTNSIVYQALWEPAYRIIYGANAIIDRASSGDNELTESEITKITAEAKFFRGYMYKMLANLYGGVPIIIEEVKEPKRDFIRASRAEVYQQAAGDLEMAAANLGEIDVVPDERVSNLATYHFLAEVYISLERWQDAITAASTVIDHSSTALMTERFGTRAGELFLIPQYETNVYWDLFRQGNQNRSTGNTEAIWVLQYEWETPGGGEGGPLLERAFSPRAWQAKIKNLDGKTRPLVPKPNAYTAGRSSGFIAPSWWFKQTLWEKSGFDQDIRNAPCNIVRDFIVRNPDSDYNGQWVFKDSLPIQMKSLNDTTRNMFPWMMKASTPGKQPSELFVENPTVVGEVSYSHHAFRDVYAIRLAETYLLRAEAYLGAGNTTEAAADINALRSRAEAPAINPSEVDIDYILDERARELYLEENRLLTLTRLGKLVERTRNLNPVIGNGYADHNDLWPIPFSEIEKNIEAVLEQNSGY